MEIKRLVQTVELEDLDACSLDELQTELVQCLERAEWAVKLIAQRVKGDAGLAFVDAMAAIKCAISDVDDAERLQAEENEDGDAFEGDAPSMVDFKSLSDSLGVRK